MLQEDEHRGGAAGNQIGDLIDVVTIESEFSCFRCERSDLGCSITVRCTRSEQRFRQRAQERRLFLARCAIADLNQIALVVLGYEERIDQPDRSTFAPPAKLIDEFK